MNKVTVQEVVDALLVARNGLYESADCYDKYNGLAERIQQHGIEVAYTPMTDDEILAIYSKWFVGEYGYAPHTISSFAWESAFEQAVLARL